VRVFTKRALRKALRLEDGLTLTSMKGGNGYGSH
jgi:hypothetical protein